MIAVKSLLGALALTATLLGVACWLSFALVA